MNYRLKLVVVSVFSLALLPAHAVFNMPTFTMPSLESLKPSRAQLVKAGKIVGGSALAVAGLYVAAQLVCGNSLAETGSFFLEGLKYPTEIGTFSPCSKYLGKTLCAKMPERSAAGHWYLEAGAGTGIVSDQIIPKLADNDHLVLAEFVPRLAEILRQKYAKEIAAGRVIVVEGDVCAYAAPQKFDYIFTTIPFNAFDLGMTQGIWSYFLNNLKPNGGISYVNYRFFPEMRLKVQSRKKVKNLKEVMTFLDTLHAQHGNGYANVNRNVPPIRVRYFKFAQPEAVQLTAVAA